MKQPGHIFAIAIMLALAAFGSNLKAQYTLTASDVVFDIATGAITDYTNPAEKDIIIPDNFEGAAVTAIAGSAFTSKQLTSVVIPSSVTTIGHEAFASNALTSVVIPSSITTIAAGTFLRNQLTSVVLPSSLTKIGDAAFHKNQLTSVEIPSAVSYIGYSAFYGNLLTSVVIPSAVDTIAANAFGSNQLTSIVIPPSITTIERSAFSSNDLTNVEIPSSVTTIGEGAFSRNELTSVVIPSSVTSIGEYAFFSNELTSAVIPPSVTTIGAAAFSANKLTTINGSSDVGIIYARKNDGSDDSTTIVSYGGVSDEIDFIPSSVTNIGDNAFQSCLIDSIVIPSAVTYIGYEAFRNNDLTSVVIPSSVTTIGGFAFYSNDLASVVFTLPCSVTTISNYCFNGNQLTSIDIPSSVNKIESRAFSTNQLTRVPLPLSANGYDVIWRDQDSTEVTSITDFYIDYTAESTTIPTVFSITYYANKGNHSNSITTYTILSEDIPITDATKDNHVFEGWYDNEAFTGNAKTSIASGSFGDVELWAKFVLPTATKSISNTELSIYPKPAKSNIMVAGAEGKTVSIYTLSGSLIKQEQNISLVQDIDISDIKSGIYIIDVGNKIQQLIVE